MKTKTKLNDDQLAFIENAFQREFLRIEHQWVRGMNRGWMDWGEWRETVGNIISTIIEMYETIGEERKIEEWKKRWKDIYNSKLRELK